MTTTDVTLTFYDSGLPSFPSLQSINPMDKSDWVWSWSSKIGNENDKNEIKTMTMVNLESDILNAEVLSAYKSENFFEEALSPDDYVSIIGTSSSTQAIVKDGVYTTMKFVAAKSPVILNLEYFRKIATYKNKPRVLFNLGFGSAIGQRHSFMYAIMCGGPIIFGTKNKKNIGLIPEVVLDDIDTVKPDICFIFPYMFSIWKSFKDNKHPDWPRWRNALRSRPKWCFSTGGAPVDPEILRWLRKDLYIQLNNIYGTSEAGLVFTRNEYTVDVEGEESYVSALPGVEYYLDPVNENENEGELYVHSPLVFSGYVDKAKEGDPNSYYGIVVNKWHDENFKTINGKEYYKTNDLWKRCPKTGNYCYISRVDDTLVFKTGIKMNPIPFESTMTLKCNSIKNCCLLLETKNQTEVFLFVEPVWDKINGLDLSNEEIMKTVAINIAKDQIWNEINAVLKEEMSSMANWVKQISKNSLYIVEYGQKIPITLKGNVSRRNCKIAFSKVLDELSSDNETTDEDIQISNNQLSCSICTKSESSLSVNDVVYPLSNFKKTAYKSNISSLLDIKKIYENDCMDFIINVIYSCITEIIPSTVPFDEFNIHDTFTSSGFNSINSVKLIKLLNSKLKTKYSTVMLFNYNTPYELAKALISLHTESVPNIMGSFMGSTNTVFSTYNNSMDGIYTNSNEDTCFNSYSLKAIPISRPLSDGKINSNHNRIAIVGIGLRLPGGINSTKKFWHSLLQGKNCLSTTPVDRQLHLGMIDMAKQQPGYKLNKNEHYIHKYGYYDSIHTASIAKPTKFDANFFECTNEEAIGMDVKQRWMLETSWEALEDAGIDPSTLENSNTGVFIGMNNSNHHIKLLSSEKATNVGPNFSSVTLHGTDLSSAAGRISYFYKLYGPAISIDTACSTGATALHTAYRSMQYGDCDLAIVSGARFLYYNDEFINISHAKMTSPKGRCATFDESADGFAPAEGCVTLILKRLDDAEESNDDIYGILLGSSNGQSGGRQSISVPSSEAQVRNIRNALMDAQISPKDISYIEAHGTGTPYGDALEIHALNQVFGESHTKNSPLYIGSVKTNIGHTCEAAGLAGIVKVLLSMKHQIIPKHINFKKLNPEIDLETIPLCIPSQKNIHWTSSDPSKPLIAQISSYGLQGSVTNIILQQYLPPRWTTKVNNTTKKTIEENINGDYMKEENINNKVEIEAYEVEDEGEEDEVQHNKYFLVTISAKNEASLIQLTKEYINELEELEEDKNHWKRKLTNFCYSSNICRKHFNTRIAAVGENVSDLIEELENRIEDLSLMLKIVNQKSKNSPQSSPQWNSSNIIIYYGEENDFNLEFIQSIKEIYQYYDYYKECFIYCEQKIQSLGGNKKHPMFDVVFDSNYSDIKNLDPIVKRLIIFSHFYSLHKLFLNFNVSINSIGGEGIGEYFALAISGVLSLEESLKLLINYHNIIVDKNKIEKEVKSLLSIQKPLRCHFYSSATKRLMKTSQYLDDSYWKILLSNIIIQEENEENGIDNLIIKQTITINPQNIAVESASTFINLDEIPETDSYIKCIYNMINILYMNGENINWKKFNYSNVNSHCTKTHLPFYQFQRSYYWPIPQNNS
ncbi:ketoacyl-synt-domain-containing protein [Neocallimastix lanati (nom. inval.)]|uniref:Ketoacyl-synt-domain-containing protein n=1 Tax=Neocallimastix californiae TaxID=1754190 RepID=A0A1Y2DD32_9FUNG|nr:ketoacyl-synt-domain-containing protein [Neocallimastix sp. JGI-2020a]ORY57026.1 ketoacyl-synt-domain-containing protein [Neocallimastix californiae]|eukprot:ORY57026.1 ketoacyl-synt-domain-containing protein [Neocallimastix californiae]